MQATVFASLLAMVASVTDTDTVSGVYDSYPSASPDGTTIVFTSNRNGRHAIWLMDRDGGDPRILFDDPEIGIDPSSPAWSPNSATIAFAMRPANATDANESEIFTIASDGTQLRRLTEVPGDDSHPHWSADGARIFFNSPRATPDLNAPWGDQWIDVYSMAINGDDVRRHTDCRCLTTYPSPSPDGQWLVFRRVVDTLGQNWALAPIATNSEIFVSRIDGSDAVNISNSPAFDGWPVWSANGQWIIFASNRDQVPQTGQIYAVRPDGSDLTRMTTGVMSRVQPSVSRDGHHLYFNEGIEGNGFEIGHIARLVPFWDEE